MKKILLVEDNETIVMGLKYSLEQENFQVISAKSVAESKEKMVWYYTSDSYHYYRYDNKMGISYVHISAEIVK